MSLLELLKFFGLIELFLNFGIVQCQVIKLKHIPLETKLITVSGFSGGGGFAMELYLAHSSNMKVMYQCGLNASTETLKIKQCSEGTYNYNKVVKTIKHLARTGKLDPLKNLASRRHYIEHGEKDIIVYPSNGKIISQFFKSYSSNVYFNLSQATHGFPSTTSCSPNCDVTFPLNNGCINCGFSGAYEVIKYLYPKESTKELSSDPDLANCSPKSSPGKGLLTFDQTEFFNIKDTKINIAKEGQIYIPSACSINSKQCKLHVNFHGCTESSANPLYGLTYLKCSGWFDVAEANNIIVLFPQAGEAGPPGSSAMSNCWDFTGYSGSNFGTKKGKQIQAIWKMITRITGKK